MGLLDSFLKGILPVGTKAPEFNLTNLATWNDYTYLTQSQNYLDQYFGWTYKASKTKADAIVAYMPEMYQETKSDKDDIEIEKSKSDLLRDLYHFNNYQTLLEARKITQLHLSLVGMAFWYIKPAENKPYIYDFFILDPQRMTQISNGLGLPRGYKFQTIKGNFIDLDARDVIVFREPNPQNWLLGMSPLQASRFQHNTSELASKFNMNVFGNMGRPDGFLGFEGIGPEEVKRLEKTLKQKYGGVNNARKIGIASMIPTWVEISKSQKDLDFVEGMKLMRDDILAIHGIPKPLVGLTDSTYTNSIEAQRIFQRYTLKPLLDNEASVYNEQLLPKYYEGRSYFDYSSFYFCFDDPVEADNVEDSKVLLNETNSASVAYNDKAITLNEYREKIGQEPLPNGDTFKVDPVITPPESSQKPPQESKGLEEYQKEAVKKAELKAFFLEKSLKDENKFIKQLKKYFTSQSKRVTKNAKSLAIEVKEFDFSLEAEIDICIAEFASIYKEMSEDYMKIANDLTDSELEISENAKIQIKSNLQRFAKEINETTREKLAQIMLEATQNDWTLEATKKAIKELYDRWVEGAEDITVTRTETIARTEVNGIKNLTSRDNYYRNDRVKEMQWLSAHDGDVRTEPDGGHKEADGQIVTRGSKFKVGGERLEYPGDKNGSPWNIINCRCTVIPIIK